MSHINTKPGQHDLTVSAQIIRIDKGEPVIILHTHKKIGKLLHFGGHVELDEDPWQSVIREINEESGYDIEQLRLLQPKIRLKKSSQGKLIPYPVAVKSVGYYGDQDKHHFHDDLIFAFVTKENPRHRLTRGESKDMRLLTRDALSKLHDHEVAVSVREVALFVLDEVLPNWEQVPAESIN